MSTSEGEQAAESTNLYLCIASASIGIYPLSAKIDSDADVQQAFTVTAPTPQDLTSDYTYLLQGKLVDFQHLAGAEESGWLIDIAHDICDPREKRGSLWVWNSDGPACLVNPMDLLRASTYEYRVPHPVRITKISRREGKSKTTATGNATTMRGKVFERDRTCWITKTRKGFFNSRICPKRLGDPVGRHIYREFTGLPTPPGLSIYSPTFGILLFTGLDQYFDKYEIGFRRTGPNKYQVHVFDSEEEYVYLGVSVDPMIDPITASLPRLHGYPVTPPNPDSFDNPPPGLFRWHYLQCVIRRFSADGYKKIKNIALYEISLPMEGDSDDEGTDDEAEWPSDIFDCGRALTY